jgi:hypothetical protein
LGFGPNGRSDEIKAIFHPAAKKTKDDARLQNSYLEQHILVLRAEILELETCSQDAVANAKAAETKVTELESELLVKNKALENAKVCGYYILKTQNTATILSQLCSTEQKTITKITLQLQQQEAKAQTEKLQAVLQWMQSHARSLSIGRRSQPVKYQHGTTRKQASYTQLKPTSNSAGLAIDASSCSGASALVSVVRAGGSGNGSGVRSAAVPVAPPSVAASGRLGETNVPIPITSCTGEDVFVDFTSAAAYAPLHNSIASVVIGCSNSSRRSSSSSVPGMSLLDCTGAHQALASGLDLPLQDCLFGAEDDRPRSRGGGYHTRGVGGTTKRSNYVLSHSNTSANANAISDSPATTASSSAIVTTCKGSADPVTAVPEGNGSIGDMARWVQLQLDNAKTILHRCVY